MRKFINIINESELREARESNLPPEGIEQGGFIQLTGWFGDVWAYVTSDYEVEDRDGYPHQTVTYCRRGKYGEENYNGMHRKPTEMAFFGHNIETSSGLMKGMQRCDLRKAVTQQEMRAKIAAGEKLILTMPQFKIDWNVVWKDKKQIGTLKPDCTIEFKDGTTADLFDPKFT